MVLSVPFDLRKDSFKDTFSEMNKFPKKEPINFCKCYDNEETTQVRSFHQSDHLIPRLWCKFYDQYSRDNILSQGHLMVVSVPYYICKD